MSETPTYHTWEKIKSRCLNPNNPDYHRYGGRKPNPVTVCAEWRDDFTAFFRDMGEKPLGASIDRIDNNLGYFKENCRWTTSQKEQCVNRECTVRIEYKGEALTLGEWSERTGIPISTLYGRIRRGWTVEKILTEPVQRRNHSKQKKAA